MDILNLLKENEKDIISWRRHLHQNPELGHDLENTVEFVCNKLDEFNIPYKRDIGTKNNVIAKITGSNKGDTIAFRADMDALPIKEETNLSFASKNGCMHACGHDAHTAILLGASKVINENKDKLNGEVVLIFQTAEEISEGARPIVKSNILKDLNVKRIYGLHVGGIASGSDNGKVHFNPGPSMACLDSFKLKVIGKGVHGAYPDGGVDPITIASYIVTSLQEIISREIPPTNPGVISIGKFHAGSTYNVIPNEVEIEGTVRAVTNEQREYIATRVGELSKMVAKGFRADVDYDYTYGAPPLVNDKDVTLDAIESAKKVLGSDNVIIDTTPVMGGEDFAEYLTQVPGTFMIYQNMLAIDGKVYPHHNPKFALDESTFIHASSLFVQIAFDN